MVVNWGFTPANGTVPDNGSIGFTNTLGGFTSYSNVTVNLNLTSSNGNTMFLGDMYSNLTIGDALAGEMQRTAVLLNRPGRENTNPFGSNASSLTVMLDDSSPHSNVWGSNGASGLYNSDGRLGISPNGSAVAFNPADRNATLAAFNGSALASNRFTLLMADYAQGGIATLSSYGYGVTGAAASSGTMSANGGSMAISDTGSAAVNNVGATVVTTQGASGGTLAVNIAGTMTFSGGVNGSGGLAKQGAGTLTLSTANTYTGNTAVTGGTLLVNNGSGSGTGTGSVTVTNAGSVLAGTGMITGPVTVGNGATLRGGDGSAPSGTLSLAGAVTMNSGSIIELALGAMLAHSTIASTGGMSFADTQAFHFLDLGAISGMYDNIITGVANPGAALDSWMITNDGWAGMFSWENGNIDLNVTPVPEPGTWAAGFLTVAVLFYSQRRRLRSIAIRRSNARQA